MNAPLVRPWTERPDVDQVRDVTIRTMVSNVPQSGKRGLYRSRPHRADEFFDMLDARLIGVACLQESGPAIQWEAYRRKGWHVIHATPNSYAWHSWQATGIAYRNDWFSLEDRDELQVDGLHLPVALLEHRRTGWRPVAMSGHAPTKRVPGALRTRARINSELDRYVEALDGAPTILGIDANSGGYRVEGLDRAHKNYVDHLLVSAHWGVSHEGTVNMPRVSDHLFVEARLHGHWVGTQLNRLPK